MFEVVAGSNSKEASDESCVFEVLSAVIRRKHQVKAVFLTYEARVPGRGASKWVHIDHMISLMDPCATNANHEGQAQRNGFPERPYGEQTRQGRIEMAF